MKRLWLAGAILCALALPANSIPHPGTIVITDDGGGVVSDYMKFYQRIELSGVPVRIEGMCVSACTLVLALPPSQVCVTERASFGFHLATINDIPQPELTNVLIHRFYPPAVQKWIADYVAKNGELTVDHVAYMIAPEILALNVFPLCAP